MAHLGNSVEYGLHCLLWLVEPSSGLTSSRDLAELQGVSPSFLAKIFSKLEKAGIVQASEGIRGGYRLARAPANISVLEVVDAIEGDKPLFDCQEIRGRCAVFKGKAPAWATSGVCAVHAVMLRAEQSMRDELGRSSLADLAVTFGRKAPASFATEIQGWLADRSVSRLEGKASASAETPKNKSRRSP